MSDEKIAKVLELLQKTDLAAAPGLAELREGFVKMIAEFALEPDVVCEPVKAGGVPSEWVAAPGADPERVILYLHGGGYVIGSIETHRELASRISRASKAAALVVDYRLAPENPHPAAVEDAVASYNWLLDEGHDPGKIVIAGDSAGGGLTLATLVALRDAGRPLPAATVCLSPWIDLECIGDSMTTKADVDPMVSKEALDAWAALYLAGADVRAPLASPLHADLKGLPSLLIQVGTRETLLDDSVRLAERARQAGVAVEYQEYEGMVHIFPIFAPILPEGQKAIDRIGEFVSQRVQ